MKRLLLLLLWIASTFGTRLTTGCSWDFQGEQFRFWLFQPELLEARSLAPFYFSTEVLHSMDEDALKEVAYEANVAEWRAVVGDDVPEEDMRAVLYGYAPQYFWKHETELTDQNAFLKRLAQLKQGWPAFIRYAKTCEALVNAADPWGFEAHDADGIARAWAEGQAMLRTARDPRLKARIAYQLVRLAHYANSEPLRAGANKTYVAHLLPMKGRTWLEPSAAFYLAGVQENPGRDLAYARIFDRAKDKQFRMVALFETRRTDEYLELADNDHHRAALLVMRCLQHPGRALKDLERIAAWDPANEHLPLLLSREVSKTEDWLLTPVLTDYGAAIRYWNGYGEEGVSEADVLQADLNYLHEVRTFIAAIAPRFKGSDAALLRLLDGHLCFVAGDMDQCRKIMSSVTSDTTVPAKLRTQAHLDAVLAQVMSRGLDSHAQADVLALVELLNTSTDLAASKGVLLDQLHLYLGRKLIGRGDRVEGLFLLARTDRPFGHMHNWGSMNARQMAFSTATPADFERMVALLERPEKTAFEHYLTGTSPEPEGWAHTNHRLAYMDLTREKLLDYKATWYLNHDSLEQAATTFRRIPDTFWTGYPYAIFADDDPFVVNVEDPHNYGKQDSVRYNKRTIVERMLALEREALRDPKKRALNHYLLGNAYYNMSWHGKYWIMSRIGWSMWENNYGEERKVTIYGDEDYYGNVRAKEHYLIALETAKDPVLKAMACLMANQCEYNWGEYMNYDDPLGPEPPYAHWLTDRRSQEAYRAIEECRSYKDFVKRFR